MAKKKKKKLSVYGFMSWPLNLGEKEYLELAKKVMIVFKNGGNFKESVLIKNMYVWSATDERDPFFPPIYVPESMYYDLYRKATRGY